MRTRTFGFLSLLVFAVRVSSRALFAESTTELSSRNNAQSSSTSSSSESPATQNITYQLSEDSAAVYIMGTNGRIQATITNYVTTADTIFANLANSSLFYTSFSAFNFSSVAVPPPRNMCNVTNVALASLDTITALEQFLEVKYTNPGPAGISGSTVIFSTGYSGSNSSNVGPATGINRTIANAMLESGAFVDFVGLQAVAEMITNESPAVCLGLGPTVGTDEYQGSIFGYLATVLIINTCVPLPLPPFDTDGFPEQEIANMLQTCATGAS